MSKPNHCHRRRLRGARQPRAIACGRVWPPDTASSDTCKCCIMLACTHLLGSCHQQRQDKEMCRVRAHCTNCEICAGNRCLVYTLAFFPAHSTSLPLFLHLLRVVALITDAHAHFDNREQCTYSRGLVYALSYVGSFGTLCPSVVCCILYQSSGTSRGSLPH